MADVILFRGTTIWDGATNGAGWSFRRNLMGEGVVEAQAPLGDGYWLKPASKAAVTHSLELAWRVTDKGALAAMISGLMTPALGSLVIPGEGTFTKCRLSEASEFESFKSDGSAYVVRSTLTFTQYL
jgi:hypothetical protein